MQLEPLEVGVLVATVLVVYAAGRHSELVGVLARTLRAVAGALRGADRPGPSPT